MYVYKNKDSCNVGYSPFDPWFVYHMYYMYMYGEDAFIYTLKNLQIEMTLTACLVLQCIPNTYWTTKNLNMCSPFHNNEKNGTLALTLHVTLLRKSEMIFCLFVNVYKFTCSFLLWIASMYLTINCHYYSKQLFIWWKA